MGRICSMHRGVEKCTHRNVYTFSVVRHKCKKPLCLSSHMFLVLYQKTLLKRILNSLVADWIRLAQGSVRWWPFVSMLKKLDTENECQFRRNDCTSWSWAVGFVLKRRAHSPLSSLLLAIAHRFCLHSYVFHFIE